MVGGLSQASFCRLEVKSANCAGMATSQRKETYAQKHGRLKLVLTLPGLTSLHSKGAKAMRIVGIQLAGMVFGDVGCLDFPE